jgi:hypothetical protein
MTPSPHSITGWRLLWLALALFAGSAEAKDTAYLGEARDEKGNLVYTERHTVRSGAQGVADSLTEYLAPDGSLIATLRSDYSRSVALPTYVFEDLRRDYREGLRWQDGGYVVFHQTGSAPEKTAPLRRDRDVFSCQGWHYYLIDNLDLLEKENIALNLVLPSELGPFPLAVRTLAADQTSVSAELKLKHWLFRYFAPKMRLEYDREHRRLREFHGVSNILSQSGERQTVTIRYTYAED